MYIVLSITIILALMAFIFLRSSVFGALPKGESLARIKASPNFRNGQFQNLNPTPQLAAGVGMPKLMYNFFFKKYPNVTPPVPIASIKTDLKTLDINTNLLVWMGHSSYYMQLDGKRILVDPVLSGSASPIPGQLKAFEGADIYKTEDIPTIDYLFISHDHYDHLDYKTMKVLQPKIAQVICGLGVAAHLERWGYASAKITENDWYDELNLPNGWTVTALPARHFSGRSLARNRSLWVSYALRTPTHNIYLGGDSGYDEHFANIGEKYGPFDLVILENGQYNADWPYIHMMPAETLQAAKNLKATKLLPVHNSKFALAHHPWNEPINQLSSAAQGKAIEILTPKIGEVVHL